MNPTAPVAPTPAMPSPIMTPKLPTAAPTMPKPQMTTGLNTPQNTAPDIAGYIRTAQGQGASSDAIYSHLKSLGYVDGTGQITSTKQAAPKDPITLLPQDTNPDDASHLSDIPKQFGQGVNQAEEGLGEFQTDSNMGEALESGLKTASGLATAVSSPLAPAMKPIGKITNDLGNKLEESYGPDVERGLADEGTTPAERALTDVSNAANVAGTLAGGKGLIEGGIDTVKNIKDSVPPDDGGAAAKAKAQTSTAAKLKGVAKDWAKPTEENSTKFDNARAALEREPNSPQFLAEQGMNPFSHIDGDGKYSTETSAGKLRQTAGKMSADTLRPSLEQADWTTPKTDVTDLVKEAKSQAGKIPHITPDDLEAIQSKIDTKGDSLQRKFSDGMGLTDMHDEKITYSKNAGYNQFKSNSDTNAALANRAMGQALAKSVEDKAPSDLDVKGFNKYLQKYYNAADYLESLDGKKAPVSMTQAFLRKAAGFGAAGAARYLIPGAGDLVSSFAGYQIGRAIEHAVENLTNPMRDSFLKNLKTTNPEAYESVANYIGKEKADQATRLALPPGKPAGSPENPIPLGRGADTSGIKVEPAPKTNLPTANPKTGRMQTTYLSSSQRGFIRNLFADEQPREQGTQRFAPKETMDVRRLVSHEGAPDTAQVEKYKSMIAAGKDIEPIKVIKEGNKYGIEDGKHRYQAYLEMGYKKVPTIVVKPK